MKSFASTLTNLRKSAQLSPAELAQRSGITKQAISLLEKGTRQPTLETARKLAKAMGKSLAVFD